MKQKNPPSKTWCECIKKAWEVDPLECPKCGSEMKIISFIDERLLACHHPEIPQLKPLSVKNLMAVGGAIASLMSPCIDFGGCAADGLCKIRMF